MTRNLMECAGCGEFCVVGTSEAGDRYRIGASRCPVCEATGLRPVADGRAGRSST